MHCKHIAISALALTCAAAFAADGTFQGTAIGHNDEIVADVTVKGGKIADVKIVRHHESQGVSDIALSYVPSTIVKKQTLNIDGISGATFSTFGVRGAVADALKKAGLDPQKFNKHVKYTVKTPAKSSADVVIVGAGGAGMSAAVAAAKAGKTVIVIEKTAQPGGNTILAGGALNAADQAQEQKQKMSEGQAKMVEALIAEKSRSGLHAQLQKALSEKWNAWKAASSGKLFDCPELHALQTWKAGDYAANLVLVKELSELAPETVKRLTQLGFDWHDYTSQYVGAIWPRCHDSAHYKSGVGYVKTYQNTISTEKLPVKVYTLTRAEDLIIKDGKVVGVSCKTADGKSVKVMAKKGVVLASGGFGANIKMRMKYDTLWNGALDERTGTTNSRAITGDGIVMAEKAGAQLIDMGYIQLLPVTDPKTGQTIATCEGTALYVNNEGKRFVNEMGRRDELSRAAQQQPGGTFWRMCTKKHARVKNGLIYNGLAVESLLKSGKLVEGKDVEELARKCGIDPKALKATFDQFNAFCKRGKDDELFNRPSCSPTIPMYEGPYYAEPRKPSVHHCMGGVKIDTETRVIDAKGNPIKGLYAAGEVTGGIHGKNRVGGNAIADALSFGWLAGSNAAAGK